MEQEVLDFIHRRFPTDCNWTCGNCYYFAHILSQRFPYGNIYYEIKNGHFVYEIDGDFYDYNGRFPIDDGYFVKWKEFIFYDRKQYFRIINNCID